MLVNKYRISVFGAQKNTKNVNILTDTQRHAETECPAQIVDAEKHFHLR